MNTGNKCKLFAYAILLIASALEIMLFCKLFNITTHDGTVLFFITSFVVLFNTSIWWFRKVYDMALAYYEATKNEED